MTKKQNQTNTDSVDQIRNILFGEQIDLINQRFEKLEQNLTHMISKLSDKMDQVNKTMQNDNSDLALQQSEDLKNLETSISHKIVETESELLNQIQSGLQSLDNKASHRIELAKLLNNMADQLAD